MRELRITVPEAERDTVLGIAREHGGLNVVSLRGESSGEPVALVIMHLRNRKVGEVLDALGDIEGVSMSLDSGTITGLLADSKGLPEHLVDVQRRSPLEVYLSGLQSIGTWPGYLGFAAAAGVVAWIALFTNSVVLLLAAILIAPFASPAMNVALATAAGDTRLLWRSVLRYAAGLAVAVAVSAALSLVFGLARPTTYMEQVAAVSSVAFLLPIVTGAAGAASLVKSEKSNLIPGTAVGALVAASLAPPAAVAGAALALGLWNLLDNAGFQLLLQLAGINLGGMLVFRLSGLNPSGERLERRQKGVFPIGLIVTVAALGALLAWQAAAPPEFQRVTRAQRMNDLIGVQLADHPEVELIRSSVEFARAEEQGPPVALVVAYVRRQEGSSTSTEVLRQSVAGQIQQALVADQPYPLVPLVDVIVLDSPPESLAPAAAP